ncbi:hypothetical protein BH09PSE4_BH09PSE4_15940 [soil metagenome]
MFPALKSFAQARKRVSMVAVYSIVNALPRVAAGILLILYARALSLQEFGVYGVLGAITQVLVICTEFGLPQAIIRHHADKAGDRDAELAYFASMVRGSRLLIVAALPVVALAMFVAWDFAGIGRAQIGYFLPILLATCYFDRTSEMLAAICNTLDRPVDYAVGRIARGAATVAAAILFVVILHWGVVGAMLAPLFGTIAAASTYHFLLARGIGLGPGRANWTELRANLRFGLPLVPNRVSAWLRQAALRPILAHLVPFAAVGLFSFAASLASLPLLLSSAVDLALAPLYFKRRTGGAQEFHGKVLSFARVYVGSLFAIWVFFILFCSNLIGLFVGSRYQDAVPACAALFCASFARLQHTFFTRQLQFLRVLWIIPAITGFGTIFTLLLVFGLTPTFGIIAAAWAVVAADTAILIGLAAAAAGREPLHYPLKMSLALLTSLILLSIWVDAGQPLPEHYPAEALKLGLFLSVSILTYFVWINPNRAFIRQLIST